MPTAMAAPSTGPAVVRKEDMHATEGASLIARAHALNHFIDMQAQASSAAAQASSASPGRREQSYPLLTDSASQQTGCLCFGGGGGGGSSKPARTTHGSTSRGGSDSMGLAGSSRSRARPVRQYFPDNLAAQPERHPWEPGMEWVIVGCVDFLEEHGLDEPNLFAVSAVDDLVRNLTLPIGTPLLSTTDPHVASGAIKARIRHATEPIVSKACLRRYIECQAAPSSQATSSSVSPSALPSTTNGGSNNSNSPVISNSAIISNATATYLPGNDNKQGSESNTVTAIAATASATVVASQLAEDAAGREFAETHLGKTLDIMEGEASARRAYVLARFMRLLGRVSAHVETSRMNAHCLAKCVAPSMLHWDPNSTFSLLMLGKITAFVMTMIEEARIHDQSLCEAIDRLHGLIKTH